MSISRGWCEATVVGVALLLTGCTAFSGPSDPSTVLPSTRSASSEETASLSGAGLNRTCTPSPRFGTDQALRGHTENGKLWGLGGLARVGQRFKLVVRMTGSGGLSVSAVGPNRSRLAPVDIVGHADSNFNRPGEEWGVFFDFPRSGCWQIEFSRGDTYGEIDLTVGRDR